MINLLKNRKYLKFISIIIYYIILIVVLIKGISNSMIIQSTLTEIIFQIIISIITIFIFLFIPIYLGLCKSPDTKIKKDCIIEKKENTILIKHKDREIEVPLNIRKEQLRKKYKFENKSINYPQQLYIRSYLLKFYDEIFIEKILSEDESFNLYGIIPILEAEKKEFVNKRKYKIITSVIGLSIIYMLLIIPALIFFLIITIKVINITEITILNYNINVITIGILLFIITSIPLIILQLNYFKENKVFSQNKLYKTNVVVADTDIQTVNKGKNKKRFYKIRIKDERDNILNKWFNIPVRDYINKETNYILYLCKNENTNKIHTAIELDESKKENEINCSICETKFEGNYCSNCGNKI